MKEIKKSMIESYHKTNWGNDFQSFVIVELAFGVVVVIVVVVVVVVVAFGVVDDVSTPVLLMSATNMQKTETSSSKLLSKTFKCNFVWILKVQQIGESWYFEWNQTNLET